MKMALACGLDPGMKIRFHKFGFIYSHLTVKDVDGFEFALSDDVPGNFREYADTGFQIYWKEIKPGSLVCCYNTAPDRVVPGIWVYFRRQAFGPLDLEQETVAMFSVDGDSPPFIYTEPTPGLPYLAEILQNKYDKRKNRPVPPEVLRGAVFCLVVLVGLFMYFFTKVMIEFGTTLEGQFSWHKLIR